MDRRRFLRTSAGAAAGLSVLSGLDARSVFASPLSLADDVLAQKYPFVLPPLGYAENAVEPTVDALTMSIHHDTHHATYVANLNKALETQLTLQDRTLRELLAGLAALPDGVRSAVRNNGGGHANHALYWTLLAPGGAQVPSGALGAAIMRDFGSLAACIGALKAAGLGQFGSGWSWLMRDGGGKLSVRGSANQDTPWFDGQRSVVGVDVWEHAYYLKYQNRRADYVKAFQDVIHWEFVGARFKKLQG